MNLKNLKKQIDRKLSDHLKIKNISVAYPYFNHKEVIEVLNSLLKLKISQGEKTKLFEKKFANFHKVKYGIAVNSGSSANLVLFAALIKQKKLKLGDEIIVPATTFATVVSPLYQLGLTPVYVDIERKNWNINSDLIEGAISKKTKAIFTVHTLGFPSNMDAINRIAKKRNLFVIEDCCEAHGATYKNKIVGSLSLASTFSFFVAHNITTGEGGMILTSDKKLQDDIRSIREFGRLLNNKQRFYSSAKMKNYDSRYIFMDMGYNLRLNDISSSIGIEQLKKLKKINITRRSNAKYLTKKLSSLKKFIYIPEVNQSDKSAYYGFPFMVKNSKLRNKLAQFLEKNKIETRAIMGGCLPDQPAFVNQKHRIHKELTNSRIVKSSGIFIGIHSALEKKHLDKIASTIKKFFIKNL